MAKTERLHHLTVLLLPLQEGKKEESGPRRRRRKTYLTPEVVVMGYYSLFSLERDSWTHTALRGRRRRRRREVV